MKALARSLFQEKLPSILPPPAFRSVSDDSGGDGALLTLSAAAPGQWLELLLDPLQNVELADAFMDGISQLDEALPAEWNVDTQSFTFAIGEVDTSEFLAVPELSLRLHGESSGVFSPPPEAVAYEWHGAPGWALPWWGDRMSFFFCQSGQTRYVANQEPLVAELARGERPTMLVDADVTLELNWGRFADVTESLVAHAAEHELLPAMNADDASATLEPFLAVIRAMNHASLRGAARDGSVSFHGYLAGERIDDHAGG